MRGDRVIRLIGTIAREKARQSKLRRHSRSTPPPAQNQFADDERGMGSPGQITDVKIRPDRYDHSDDYGGSTMIDATLVNNFFDAPPETVTRPGAVQPDTKPPASIAALLQPVEGN